MSNRERAAYIVENYGLNCTTCNEKKDICSFCATRARIAVDELISVGLLVLETDRPVTLSTAEDYANAPTGTIVADDGYAAYVKKKGDSWESTYNCRYSDKVMSDLSRTVLRWGPGGEA